MSPSPVNHLKRKEPGSDSDTGTPTIKSEPQPTVEPDVISFGSNGTATVTVTAPPARPDEYEAGRVICEDCGASVSFRDDDSGGFTLKQWEAHRTTCPAASQRPVTYTPAPPTSSTDPHSTHLFSALHPTSSSSTAAAQASTSAGPNAPKRRRAKRTEEERIEYLRADPYVGQFEAYRVLCASCDKWIRLRPNSTYCSIPWDAHRKSCLAKKITTKNPYALSERNTLFAKDPDVRKFDPERLLCNICDRWLTLPPDDHLGAVQRWLSHRAGCGRLGVSSSGVNGNGSGNRNGNGNAIGNANGTTSTSVMSGSRSPPAGARTGQAEGSSTHPPSTSLSPRSPAGGGGGAPSQAKHLPPAPIQHQPALAPLTTSTTQRGTDPASPPSPYLLTPLTYAPAHESRRRNAEQRAATLRADRLIGKVEPNRVFCSLCEKWVQLRQDSSYCAYPWVQHRGKCLRRSERRNAKAAELAHLKVAPPPSSSQHPGPSNPPHHRLTHPSHGSHSTRPSHSSHSTHSTHPSHSSTSHSALGLGYPSSHAHQRAMGHGGRMGAHPNHTRDEIISDAEFDMEERPRLSASPSVSMSGSDNDDADEEEDRAGRAKRRRTKREAGEDEEGVGVESEDDDGGEAKARASAKAHAQAREKRERGARHTAHAQARSEGMERERERRARAGTLHGHPNGNGNGHAHPNGQNGPQRTSMHRRLAQQPYISGRMSMAHAVSSSSANGYHPSTSSSSSRPSGSLGVAMGAGASTMNGRGWEGPGDDADAEGEIDVDGEGDGEAEGDVEAEAEWRQEMEAASNGSMTMSRGLPRRPQPVGLADLDSSVGRKHFIQTSLTHLFSTTYEPADELCVSALLTYLNAAMPPDKHEDFDTAEVARAVAALAERGRVIFEGDIVRVVQE